LSRDRDANPLPPAQRLRIARQRMPERGPSTRATDFGEVNLGFRHELAREEAMRCLQCAKPACVKGCPVGVKVKEFVDLCWRGEYLAAAAKIREDNVLPAITGRVCPQEEQCEGACIMGRRVEPLAIGYLERFVADYERRTGRVGLPARAAATGKKVAVIGSGPAGLTAAGDLVQKGHEVTVFEALHEIGGVLLYGIPEFRLPKEIVRAEVENLRRMGVRFETNIVVGRSVGLGELMDEEGYGAVFVGTGAGLPKFLEIPGEEFNGVYSANEFLTRVNLMKGYQFPRSDSPVCDCEGKDVLVVGGGNTALDAIRCTKRLGASRALLMYRRSQEEMPARIEEVKHAKEEGVEFLMLASPTAFLGDECGRLRAARCVRMELGQLDSSGRRCAVEIDGSDFEVPVAIAIVAVGTSANPTIQSTAPDLAVNRGGYISVDERTMKSTKRGVFAGGDIVTGSATVILAMGAGRQAARAIHEYLSTGQW